MRVDLHNHTTYCNHAIGSMEEYIKRASEIGIDIFGFSCHAPMDFDKKYRMDIDTMPIYFDKIKALRDSSDIEILCALEVDYILGREDLLLKEVLEAKVDYLIGSVHFIDEWGFDNPEFIGEWKHRGIDSVWDSYLDSIKAMINSGYFHVIGHLDLPKLFCHRMDKKYMQKVRDILELAKGQNMAMEVNAAGLRKPIKEQYPSQDILKLAKEIGLDITMSSDAHSIEQIGFGYDECYRILRDLGFEKLAIFRDREKILCDLG